MIQISIARLTSLSSYLVPHTWYLAPPTSPSLLIPIKLRIFFLKNLWRHPSPGNQDSVIQQFLIDILEFNRSPAWPPPGIGHRVDFIFTDWSENVLEFLSEFQGASFFGDVYGDEYFFIYPAGDQIKMGMLIGLREGEGIGFDGF